MAKKRVVLGKGYGKNIRKYDRPYKTEFSITFYKKCPSLTHYRLILETILKERRKR